MRGTECVLLMLMVNKIPTGSTTGLIQSKVMTTLPLKFKGLWDEIENLKQQTGRDINHVTFRNFVPLFIQKFKILGKKLICSQCLDLQFL